MPKLAEWEVWLPGFWRDDFLSLFKTVTLKTNYFVYYIYILVLVVGIGQKKTCHWTS